MLTILVTSAGAERILLKLKLIETNLQRFNFIYLFNLNNDSLDKLQLALKQNHRNSGIIKK